MPPLNCPTHLARRTPTVTPPLREPTFSWVAQVGKVLSLIAFERFGRGYAWVRLKSHVPALPHTPVLPHFSLLSASLGRCPCTAAAAALPTRRSAPNPSRRGGTCMPQRAVRDLALPSRHPVAVGVGGTTWAGRDTTRYLGVANTVLVSA